MKTLAVKYRPTTFSQVVGHHYITTILEQQIKTDTPTNAYLFCGPSGIGKTTVARIFANYLTENHPVIEYNGSNMTGVEDARELEIEARRAPIYGKYKVYIIDECHMLTKNAWNSMLKMLEEPPMYTVFIFCTTEPNKIPKTILSRMQIFEFSPPTVDLVYTHLMNICEDFEMLHMGDVCSTVANNTKNIREAISQLEKVIDYLQTDNDNFNSEVVFHEILKLPEDAELINLDIAVERKDEKSLITTYEKLVNGGISIDSLVNIHLNYLIDNYLEKKTKETKWMIKVLTECKKGPISLLTVKAAILNAVWSA